VGKSADLDLLHQFAQLEHGVQALGDGAISKPSGRLSRQS
jgi:hypothetical protein